VSTVLDEILTSTRAEVERRKRELPLRAEPDGHSSNARRGSARRLRDALRSSPEIAVIAEFKRRSPSAGQLHAQPELHEIVSAYQRGGAAALSILTEGPHFAGSLEDLREARTACALPILRKDFIVDTYQLHEAALAGADAVLLIVAALDAQTLASLHDAAAELGLDALVEVHEREELDVALGIGAELIGINNRDLRDFSVDVQRTSRLMAEIPPTVTVVSESGIASAEQLRALREEGVQAVLVGEALMRAEDPEAALRALQKF
jgi:indole-3-glycerol phosphate synthase